jgi:hypothetical protein
LGKAHTEQRSALSREAVMDAPFILGRFKIRTALTAGIIVGAASIGIAPSASAFEPPADPEDKFTCPGGTFVPGHPGFPGIATGTDESFVNSGRNAAAAWSATTLFGGPLAVC